jgi:hypothetical protein
MGDVMDLGQALTDLEARAVLVEARIAANGSWLTTGFLADDAFTPQLYVERAAAQKHLLRELRALAEPLWSEGNLSAAA